MLTLDPRLWSRHAWQLHEAGAPLNVTNEYGGTPLMAAVSK